MRSEQSMIDSWAEPFEQEFGKDSGFAIYEVPMINASWKVFSWMIDSGLCKKAKGHSVLRCKIDGYQARKFLNR